MTILQFSSLNIKSEVTVFHAHVLFWKLKPEEWLIACCLRRKGLPASSHEFFFFFLPLTGLFMCRGHGTAPAEEVANVWKQLFPTHACASEREPTWKRKNECASSWANLLAVVANNFSFISAWALLSLLLAAMVAGQYGGIAVRSFVRCFSRFSLQQNCSQNSALGHAINAELVWVE